MDSVTSYSSVHGRVDRYGTHQGHGEKALKRVAYASSFADFIGGGEYSLLDLMLHLPADVEPVLLVPKAGALSERAGGQGIRWYQAPMPLIGIRTLPALRVWRRLINEIRPDILHANNPRSAFYAGMSGRLLRIPVLFHCRVTETDPRLDRWLVRLVNGVVANSQATAGRFSAWPSLKVWTVYNGMDLSIWQQNGQHGDEKPFGATHLVLVVARVSPCKRHDLALDLFSRLSEKFPGLHLVFIGGMDEKPWWNELQARTSKLPAASRVHWLGEVDRNALAKWYAVSDVLLLPSDDESFGRVLVEAMGMGVPVIAFAAGGIPEVVQNGRQGLLIKPGDLDAMELALESLLNNADLRRNMGEAGRGRAIDFSIDRHVSQICGIYSEIVA